MKKRIILQVTIAVMAAVLLLSVSQMVSAYTEPPVTPKPNTPAAGSWSWDDENVTGTIIPQYQLAPTNDDDYALLQSAGLHVSGSTQLCHPYPGGQFGWNAEIRVLTNTGWQSVPTVNQWVPDEEGKFMTCAQTWYSGTYAVFGYWEKYDDWDPHYCASLPDLGELDDGFEWQYVSSAATFDWDVFLDFVGIYPFHGTTGDRCSADTPGAIETDHLIIEGVDMGPSGPVWVPWMYCGCGSMYQIPFSIGVSQAD